MKFPLPANMKSFFKLGGNHIFVANVFSKLLSFTCSVAAIRLLTTESYGAITYALSLILFLRPFMGGGAHFGILRFGPLQKDNSYKNFLYKATLLRGSLFNTIILTIPVLLLLLPIFDIEESRIYTVILGLHLLFLFPLEMIKSHFRVLMKNRTYAYIDVVYYTVQLMLILSLVPLFRGWGYIAALIFSPLVIFILYTSLFTSNKNFIITAYQIDNREFWSYSTKVSFGSSAGQLLYVLDFFLIGLILSNSQELAGYRSATIIPMSLLFIPLSYITTYYVTISAKSKDRAFLQKFVSTYWKIFIPVTLAVVSLLFLEALFIMRLFFGEEYEGFYMAFRILAVGIGGAFLFRIPFGNLLMGVGLAGKNLQVSIFTLVINLLLNLLLIPEFGINGAAWATTASIWFSGFLALLYYKLYLNRLPNDRNTHH